uniref:DH domain-containing protein n=1 Tax=Anopheles epiroticus TaxID=199890 RepID=A0A182PFW8_9DIPT
MPSLPDGLSSSERQRWLSFGQFITHEQNYLDALHKLQYEIYNQFVRDDAIIDRDVSYAIFGTHRQICKLHQFLQVLLEVCVREWPEQTRAGWMLWAMVGQPGLLQLYRSFVQNYANVMALYAREVERNALFAWFVTTKLQEFGERLDFSDYFIMTVQRVPQLVMEVRELCSVTPVNHPDRELLERCLQRVVHIAEQLNVAQGRSETVQMVMGVVEGCEAVRGQRFLHDRHQCQLLHSELLEMVEDATSCPRQTVLLLSDRLVCLQAPQQSFTRIYSTQQEHALGSLRWAIPLQELQLGREKSLSAEVCPQDTIRYVRDFQTITDMRELVCTFHHEHDTLGEGVFGSELDKIWSTVLPKKENEREASLLYVKGRLGAPHILRTRNALSKKEWLDWIRLARLALHPANLPAWWGSVTCTERSVQYEQPLFVRTFQAGECRGYWSVTGGCCYVPNVESFAYSNELFRAWSRRKHILWISSLDDGNNNSRISLYTHDRTTHAVDERASFTLVNMTITCMAHVPEGRVDEGPNDTVWISTWKRLLIYSATFPLVHERLKSITIKGTPNRILYSARRVLVGTTTGRLLIFSIMADDRWNLRTPQQILLRGGSIEAMALHCSSVVYIAVGAYLHVFDGNAGIFVQMATSRSNAPQDRKPIAQLECSTHGLWIVRHRSGEISLYHTQSFQHLLDVDVLGHVMSFLGTNQISGGTKPPFAITVTSLKVVDDMLWAGTNIGVVLCLQLPQYGNVPTKADLLAVAHHGHVQNVTTIIPIHSLRMIQPEQAVGALFDQQLVDNLYRNTRRTVRDFIVRGVGIDAASLAYIDNVANGVETSRAVASCSTGRGYAHLESPEHERTWSPNSTLIVTGGRGYARWSSSMPDNVTAQLSRTKTIDQDKNIILWEMRLA